MSRGGETDPLRILMTVDTIGGVWTYALELARALRSRQVEFCLAAMGPPLTTDQRAAARSLPNVAVFESTFRLEWMHDPWCDVHAAGEWLLDLEQQVQPDVVHLNGYAHGAFPFKAPRIVVAHSCVLSWWRAVHGFDAPGEWKEYRRAVTAGIQGAEVLIAPSRAMLSSVEDHYGPIRSGRVIPNGRQLSGPGPAIKEKMILSAGRMWDPAKNAALLAGVASELPWPVYLAGENKDLDGRETSYAAVSCLGQLSSDELEKWFARASIYALPARYEPFGLSALEAAWSECALVLGDIASLREIWGEAALFVNPNCPAQLRAALMELIDDPAKLRHFALKARERAARYAPECMAAQYLDAYQRAVNVREGKEELAVCES
jgi:glycogen synthase